jgi:8-oxo-dGTP pyrophosphatase MutT (NUDIX family)
MSEVKRSACVLIQNELGHVLALRRSDGKGYGFPGGKVEEGEVVSRAAVRECFEETGYVVELDKSQPLFVTTEGSFEVSTYKAYVACVGTPTHSHEGEVCWVDPQFLVNESNYGDYNRECFEHFNVQLSGE